MPLKDKVSYIEKVQMEKLATSFTMDEWFGFSIKAIVAHLIDCDSYEEVELALKSLKDD